ncbi:MAG: hypothetical protein ACD_78C00320G0009 [uncultured bacterium (gcode 4)]|uniref:Uncharacterized protein n=1 Tax=uncultured bacterium (gcode 4) TaxID=1234023 RepID=K1XHA5_9BACT|nr:MAG: hypothetical protein ACD_78C00320G0009 [uncultured bacterium (gcode 4)]HBB26978.1 hypothetical protein [Candidatus Gracilibacteria bacterium]
MFWLGFGIYTIFMVLIFGFFIVAKIHIYKFRHYSVRIEPITKTLAITLLILALVGYYLLFSGSTGSTPTQTVETVNTQIY